MRTHSKRLNLRSAAFTLVEVIVALVVILILAAVALPSLAGYLDQKRIVETVTLLNKVGAGLYTAGGNGFFQKVGAHPGKLSQLTNQITGGNANISRDLCLVQFSNAEATNWLANAPFVNIYINPVSGLPTGVGTAQDSLFRVQITGVWTSRIQIPSVTVDDAFLVDSASTDAGNGRINGWVQWTIPAGSPPTVTLQVHVPINNVC